MNPATGHTKDTESTKPSRFRMIAHRLLEAFSATWWGPVVAWWATALVHLAVCVVAPPLRIVGSVLVAATGAALLLATLAAAVAWLRALGTHRWKRAAVQFVLGILSIPVFAVGGVVAAIAGRTFALVVAPQSESRTVSIGDGGAAAPFSIRFTPSHPFLAEYDRCIVFPSGKRIGIWPDTGGGGPFAVYRLASGEYYLVCGLEHDWVRFDCRVNPENETVETMRGDRWIAIPDGTKAVTGGSSQSICVETGHGEKTVGGGVPVGDSLDGRTFLGYAHPDGRFEPGGADPLADRPGLGWTAAALPASVPFRFEVLDRRDASARIVFPSGRTRGVFAPLFDKIYELHALGGGGFLLVVRSGTDWPFGEERYRVDPENETLEILYDDAWFAVPEEALGSRIRSISLGPPRRSSVSFDTPDGSKEVEESIPVGDSLASTTFLGTIRPDGSFTPAATPAAP